MSDIDLINQKKKEIKEAKIAGDKNLVKKLEKELKELKESIKKGKDENAKDYVTRMYGGHC